MRQRDLSNTGRASLAVHGSRQGTNFFGSLLWQKPTPSDGPLTSSTMVFYDGAGPGASDLVVGGYHWPKGVQGMDRHTGRLFWNGNPDGGELIGTSTAAFSPDGRTLYVHNDATPHPLMAFSSVAGPSSYWHNGDDPVPYDMGMGSPKVAADGRIFSKGWCDHIGAAIDSGTSLRIDWSASASVCSCMSGPAILEEANRTLVVSGGRCGVLKAFDGRTGDELWSVAVPSGTDADPTIDPESGNTYLPVGTDSIWIVGVDKTGQALWGSASRRIHEWQNGQNNPQVARSAGCLSHDGKTYYFQTTSLNGDGKLYAVNTQDGSLKWSYSTASKAGESVCSSPVVTLDGTIVVGNNLGGVYFALKDSGSHADLLDRLILAEGGIASSSATISPDGILYLPARLKWVQTNGDNETPSQLPQYLFNAFDLTDPAHSDRPPTIRVDPSDTTAALGALVSLHVTAESAAPMTFQWRFGSLPIPAATNAVLDLALTNAAAFGAYDVVVANAYGAVTSRAANVSIRMNTVDFEVPTLTVGELQGQLVINLRRSGSTNALSIPIATGGSAVTGTDYRAAAAGSVSGGATTGTTILRILDDPVVDGRKTLTLTLKTNGLPDVVLGANATLTITIEDNDTIAGPGFGFDGQVSTIAALPDGRVLVGGDFESVHGSPRSGMARLLADLSLDPSFSPAAFVSGSSVQQIAVQPDGGILLRGSLRHRSGQSSQLRRLRADGGEDESFASLEGVVQQTANAAQVAVDGSGRTYAVGSFTTGNNFGIAGLSPDPNRAIVRLLPDGSRDPEFAALFARDPAGSSGSDLALTRDGRVVLGGSFRNTASTTNRSRIARLLADGSFDASFATGPGFSNSVSASAFNRVNALAADLMDRILVAGTFNRFAATAVPGWARLNPDGSLDASFAPSRPGTNIFRMEALRDGGIVVLRNDGTLEEFTNDGAPLATLAKGAVSFGVETAGTLLVGSSSGARLQRIHRTGEPSIVRVELGWGTQIVSEAAPLVRVPVWRTGPADAPAEVRYRIAAGSAAPGADFLPTDGSLTIAAGIREAFITIPLTAQNQVANDDRTIRVELLSATGATILPPRSACTVTLEDDDVGLTAEVFASQSSTVLANGRLDSPTSVFRQRIDQHRDSVVHFEWDGTSPRGASNDFFAIIWSGWLVPEVTGTYQLATIADDGTRLWFENQLILTNWFDTPAALSTSSPMDLQAGRKYRLSMQYFEGQGNATCRLLWKPPGEAQWSTVPRRMLRPGSPQFIAPSLEVGWVDDPTQMFRISYTAEPGRPISIQTSTDGLDWRFVAEAATPGLGAVNSFSNTPAPSGLVMPAGGLIRAMSVDGLAFTNPTRLPLVVRVTQSATNVVAGTTNTLNLRATANGGAGQSITWLRDGVEVGAGTSLPLNGAQPDWTGDYQALVTAPAGRILSPPRRVALISLPLVTDPLLDKTFLAGDSTVWASGITGLDLAHQWFKDGAALAAQTGAALVLGPVKPTDAGLYTVVATNLAGRITNGPARVRVHSPVAIRSQLPPLTTLNAGQGFTFTADVDGSGPFQFQWRLNGQDIPGATAATYTVPAATLEHAGTYTVVIVDEFGAVTSDPAVVVVNTPARPAGDNFAQRVSLAGIASPISGTNTNATIEKDEPLHAAKPDLHSVWYSWSTPIAGRVTFRTVGSAFDTLLAVYTGTAVNALTEVASNDDAPGGGFFTSEVSFSAQANTPYAIAISGLGDESGDFVLSWTFTSSEPLVPHIVTHPGNTTQVAGGPVTLRVTAENATSVEWQLNGQLLAGVSGDTLLLPALDVSQVGTYVAVLHGGGQTIYSHPAIVEIGPQAGVHSYDKPEEFGTTAGGGGAAAGGRYEREDVGITAPALIVTPGLPVSQWVNNAVNTTQQGEQNHCEQLVRRTGWLPVQAKVDGYLVITATNTTVPTALALYEAANPQQSIACAQGNTVVLSSARAGRLYWLAFGSKTDTGGPIQIVCTAGVPPPVKKFEPELADVPPDSTVKLLAPQFEGMNPPPKYTWYRDGKRIEGAASAELILSGADANAPGRYSVQLDNGVGRELYDVAQLDLDLPLTTRSGTGGGPGFDGTAFGFHLDGNPGQQVSVMKGAELNGWTQEQAFWLPAGGLNYRDPGASAQPIGFYAAREVPLTVVADGTYTDGRRGWKVLGGRLGRSYVLESSADGKLWTPVRTNRVTEGTYHHVTPAGGNGGFLRVKP